MMRVNNIKKDILDLHKQWKKSSEPSDHHDDTKTVEIVDSEVANKLKILSGIELTRVKTTGEETDIINVKNTSPDIIASHDNKAKDEDEPVNMMPEPLELEDEFISSSPRLSEVVKTKSESASKSSRTSLGKTVSTAGSSVRRTSSLGRGSSLLSRTLSPPAPVKSKKSLFESSQLRRRSGTPLMTSSPIVPSSSSSLTSANSVRADKKRKVYQKLMLRIRGVHPELDEDQTMEAIMMVRDEKGGSLAGLTMPDIIASVYAAAKSKMVNIDHNNSEPVGDEFEELVNAPLQTSATTKTPTNANIFELSCQFCSRVFKSPSESATRKVYEIHMKDHQVENKSLLESANVDYQIIKHLRLNYDNN